MQLSLTAQNVIRRLVGLASWCRTRVMNQRIEAWSTTESAVRITDFHSATFKTGSTDLHWESTEPDTRMA